MASSPFLAALLDRGVWQAPWVGPDGELVLLAVTRAHALNEPPHNVAHGASRIEAAERMMAALDRDDPVATLRVIGRRSS
jgi:hypothetical protein